MAKIGMGGLDGFQGKVGPVVGYRWNGKWCMRGLPRMMHNPRTDKQMEHRSMFKQEVQLAAAMRWAVTTGLTDTAREYGMTSYNLFVSINQPCFGITGDTLEVDYASLALSMGPTAPIALSTPVIDEHNSLTVSFAKNPQRMRCSNTDLVHIFVYCPTLKQGVPAEPVFRSTGRVAIALPTLFQGQELHVYGFAQDGKGRCSTTSYAAPECSCEAVPTVEIARPAEPVPAPAAEMPVAAASTSPEVAKSTDEPPATEDPMQLTLW